MEALALPSKEAEPVTSPVKEIVLAVASFVAVAALPVIEIPQVPLAPPPVLVTV